MRGRGNLRSWAFACAAAAVLLGLRAAASPPTAPPANTETLLMRGTPGESEEHALVDLRELVSDERAVLAAGQRRREEYEEPRLPPKLPLPADAPLRLEPRRPHRQAAEAPRLTSPPLASSFQALLDDGRVFPPDTEGAVGPNHIVTTLNSQARVQDRSGHELLTLAFETFWSKVSAGLSLSDPKVLYEPYLDRWIAAAVAGMNTKDSSVLVGVSQSGDPTGSWNLYRVDVDSDGKVWADFPSLGFNKDWIAIQANVWDVSVSGKNFTFRRTHIYVFDKADLVSGATDARFTLFARDDLGSCQVPAATYDPQEPVLYLLEDWDGNSGGVGSLRLFSISGPVGSEIFRSISFPATEATWDDGPPGGTNFAFAPQKGSAVKIADNDADFTHVAFRNGLITAAHTIFLPAGGAATRSAVQWWQLTTDGFIVQRGRLEDSAGGTFYAFPSVAPNLHNDLLLGFSVFSAQEFAAGGYAFRAAGDTAGTLREGAVLKSGESAYIRGGFSSNRWGDYSASALDPVNGLDLWTIQEYAAQFSQWGTWWGRIVPDSGPVVPLPIAAFDSPASATAGQPVAFADTSSGATQWFWNFGDGTTVAERNPVHVFGIGGTLTVTETAVNQTGAAVASRTIQISGPSRLVPVPPPRRPRGGREVKPRG